MNLNKEQKFYRFLHRAFESHNPKDPLALTVDILYVVIILASSVFAILEVTKVWDRNEQAFQIFEYIMVGLFFVEWIESFATIDFEYPELPVYKRKLKWIFSFESIVDIVCLTVFVTTIILEYYEIDVAYLELISLIKLVRLYKLVKYNRAYKQIVKEKKERN